MKVGPWLVLVFFAFNLSHSQSRTSGRSGQGSLTVTVTVVPSVRLVAEPNGKGDVVVSNAPDSKESFFLAPVRSASRVDVQFSIPGPPPQYEVTQKTVMMSVDVGGKTERRLVIVTTGVPR
ncbi:MAG TPA: hypothetical protein VFO40_10150 [Chthoniobacterales bacterium]|nr:hypothetical protein [Chthoniobacterales bacterium]